MDMEIDFNYCGSSTIIQCNSKDKMDDIFKKLSNKTEVNLKSLLFFICWKTIERRFNYRNNYE